MNQLVNGEPLQVAYLERSDNEWGLYLTYCVWFAIAILEKRGRFFLIPQKLPLLALFTQWVNGIST